MMTLQQASDDTFEVTLERLREQCLAEDPLNKLRTAAWELLRKNRLPTTRNEVFRYVTLRKLYGKDYSPAKPTDLTKTSIAASILPECQQSCLVFVNGTYSPELSNRQALPESITIQPLATAFRTYGAFITNAWQRNLANEKDPFALINAALHPSAAFIYVPPKVVLETPIQILSIIDLQDQTSLVFPRWHLFAGNSSSVKIVSTQTTLSGASFASIGAFDVSLEENARINITQMAVTERDDIWLLEAARAYLKRNSTLDAIVIKEGGETIRVDWYAALAGENAEANLNGLGLYDAKQEGHIHVLIDHQAPHCRSMQLFKNVLRGTSRSSFEGKIYVHQAAQKTDAFQLNNNLILSDNCQAYSKPNLEIFADDVKASHGATIGQLDDDQLFYLQARGLSLDVAQNLLIQGFCREVIDKISIDSVLKEAGRKTIAYVAELA